MRQEKINTVVNKRSWVNSLFSTCTLLLLTVYTAFGTIESINDIIEIQSQENVDLGHNIAVDNTDHYSLNFSHNPFHLPGDSNPFNENEDEKDNLDEDELCKSPLLSNSLFKIDFDKISAEYSVRQFEESVANREKISLFILHHSWKTFLI